MSFSAASSSTSTSYYCPHCKEFVSKSTFFSHRLRYFINGQWTSDCVEKLLDNVDSDSERDRSDLEWEDIPHNTLDPGFTESQFENSEPQLPVQDWIGPLEDQG